MTHKLITDEMVEKAATAFVGQRGNVFLFDRTELQKDIRAALETAADDLIEVVAKKIEIMDDEHPNTPSCWEIIDKIRSLKSQGQ